MSFLKRNWPLGLYGALIFNGIFFHECWRDELQALLISHDQKNILDVFTKSLKYEGHPGLWHILLHFFTSNEIIPLQMQILNAIIMISAASLFWFYFPIEGILKTILLFNYYFLFEYGLIARSYSLGILLLFYFLAFYQSPKIWLRNSAFLSFYLVGQTSIYGLMITGCIQLYRLLNYKEIGKQRAFLELCFYSITSILTIGQIIQPTDSTLGKNFFLSWDINHALSTIASFGFTLLHLPVLSFDLKWESVQSNLSHGISLACLATIIISICFIYLKSCSKKAAWSFLIGTTSLILFTYFIYFGSFRHKAHFILLFASFFWICKKENKIAKEVIPQHLVFFLAGFSLMNGLIYYTADLFRPFSDAKSTVNFLKNERETHESEKNLSVVIFSDEISSSLSGYLNGTSLLSMRGATPLTYTIWDERRKLIPINAETFKNWLNYYNIKESFLILNTNLPFSDILNFYNVTILYKSQDCIVVDECYTVLKIKEI